ncbi:tail fiber assembly protein [Salmonella enterica]|nr:tail fiber assembly protein [Salmonella enterica]EKT1465557.1 tail fiber assembly protein [Salmonella enterica]EKT3060176.1 tail fiber assembly protein [Salmonella enterica]
MYIGPHGHVVIVDADGNAETFGLMDGGVDAAITAYFGSQLQERVQDAVDLDEATNKEKASLLAWRKYRVQVNRVDTLKPVWPEKPASSL